MWFRFFKKGRARRPAGPFSNQFRTGNSSQPATTLKGERYSPRRRRAHMSHWSRYRSLEGRTCCRLTAGKPFPKA